MIVGRLSPDFPAGEAGVAFLQPLLHHCSHIRSPARLHVVTVVVEVVEKHAVAVGESFYDCMGEYLVVVWRESCLLHLLNKNIDILSHVPVGGNHHQNNRHHQNNLHHQNSPSFCTLVESRDGCDTPQSVYGREVPNKNEFAIEVI